VADAFADASTTGTVAPVNAKQFEQKTFRREVSQDLAESLAESPVGFWAESYRRDVSQADAGRGFAQILRVQGSRSC